MHLTLDHLSDEIVLTMCFGYVIDIVDIAKETGNRRVIIQFFTCKGLLSALRAIPLLKAASWIFSVVSL